MKPLCAAIHEAEVVIGASKNATQPGKQSDREDERREAAPFALRPIVATSIDKISLCQATGLLDEVPTECRIFATINECYIGVFRKDTISVSNGGAI